MQTIRRILECLIFVAVACFLLCLTAWAYLNSEYAKPQIAQAIEKSLSKFTGSNISIGAISFSLPATFTLTDIALSEKETPWITAKSLRMTISPGKILEGNLTIKSVELNDANLLTLPSLKNPESHPSPFVSLNFLASVPLTLEQVKLNHVTLFPEAISQMDLFPEQFSKKIQLHAEVYPDFAQGTISSTLLLGPAEDATESLSKVDLSIEQQGSTISAAFDLNESKAGLLSELIGYPLPNDLHLQGCATSSLDDLKSFNSSFTLDAGKLIQGEGEFFLLPDKSLHLKIQEACYGPLVLQGNILLSPEHTLEGSELNISLKENADFQHKLPIIVSGLKSTCRLHGKMDAIHASIEFEADELAYEATKIKSTVGKLETSQINGKWGGLIHLTTFLENIPVETSSHFEWMPGKVLSFSDFSIMAFDSIANGVLIYEQDSGWLEANVKGSCPNLSCLTPWLPEPINGKAEFILYTVQWLHSATPSIEIQIDAPNLTYKDMSLKDIAVVSSISDIFNHWQGNIYSSIGQMINKEMILDHFTLATTINSEEKKWPYILSIGDHSTALASFESEGYWFLDDKTFHLSINHLQGQISDTLLSMQEPSRLNVSPLSFELTPLSLKLGNGTLKTSIDFHESSLSSSLQFENLPLELLHLNSSTLPVQGLCSGQATMYGPLEAPKMDGELLFKEVKINKHDFADAPLVSGKIQMHLDEKGLTCSGHAIPTDHPPLHFDTHLPITFSFHPLHLNIDKTASIAGNIKASGEIQTFLQLILATDAIHLSGPIDAAVSITGTMESPLVNGTATISNASFEILDTGAVLQGVSGYFESSGKEIILKQLTASDKHGGTLTGSGTLLIDDSNQFPFQLDFNVHHLALLDQDFAKGSFSGHLSLKGDAKGATLTGSATADTTTITIPEQTAATMNSIDVTYINQPEHEKIIPIEKTTPWPFLLDINVTAPENVIVRGKDLTSEWKGNLGIKGPATNLLFLGNFKVISGQYLFNGKDFAINQGTFSLNGALDNKSTTTLYVIASKDLGKVKVEVIVKGPVTNPEISFRSNPPLPQREILSWILFNRGTSEISPFQGTQITESITNLKNNHKGPDVLTKIRNSLGIDRFDISRDENNGNAVSIQVGKYISQNVFVSVNKSTVNRIAVEAALMRNIKLQAQVGDDSQGQLLLKWKHDY